MPCGNLIVPQASKQQRVTSRGQVKGEGGSSN